MAKVVKHEQKGPIVCLKYMLQDEVQEGGKIHYYQLFRNALYYPESLNVRCNCISPGVFQTEAHPDAFVERYSNHMFLGRMANHTDLMGVIVFLAFNASVYVTGANIPVDGGYTAK